MGAQHPTSPNPLTEVQKAYLAALIDGEGYVGLHKRAPKKGQERGHYAATVGIGMVDPLICQIQKEVGLGSIYLNVRKGENHKPVYMWFMSSNAIRGFLPLIFPYLRFKRRQAQLLLEYLAFVQTKPNGPGGDEKWLHYRQRVKDFYEELKILNKRGRR